MRRFALPKSSLLRKTGEFDAVYRYGKRLHGKGFTLISLTNHRDCNRIGISISRKLKGAVKRNRIKRIFRESFRLNRGLYPPDADIVVTVRPDFSLNSPDLITEAVAELLSRQSRSV